MLAWCTRVFEGREMWLVLVIAMTARDWYVKPQYDHWWTIVAALIASAVSLILTLGFIRIIWNAVKEMW